MLTASGTDLEALCERGSFRSDLYFRLNEYTIFIPPLRQRCEDIPYLAKRFMDIANIELSKFIQGFSPAAVEAMLAYRWLEMCASFAPWFAAPCCWLRRLLTSSISDWGPKQARGS